MALLLWSILDLNPRPSDQEPTLEGEENMLPSGLAPLKNSWKFFFSILGNERI